jgi:hypothetical protein
VISKRLVVVAAVVTAMAMAAVPGAQQLTASDETPFSFQLKQTEGHRGLAVEGWVYNGLAWRITNVRLRIDGVDPNGAVIVSAAGWVLGDVPAHGQGYFYVPVSAPAVTYRASVQEFNKVALEAPAPQTP